MIALRSRRGDALGVDSGNTPIGAIMDIEEFRNGIRSQLAVAGLQEPGKMNVLSLRTAGNNRQHFRFDETGNAYKVLWCDEPLPTEFGAARLAIDGRVTLKVAPILGPRPEQSSPLRLFQRRVDLRNIGCL